MSNNDDNIIDLLNNDSFIKWLDGNADFDVNKKWNDWLNQNPDQRGRIISRIEKLRSIPFQEARKQDIRNELNKLEKTIKKEVLFSRKQE